MLRIGSTIRSAKMKAITPPKLMPPFQKTAASGTFPIEGDERDDGDEWTDQRAPYLGERRMIDEEERLPEGVRHSGGECARDQQAA